MFNILKEKNQEKTHRKTGGYEKWTRRLEEELRKTFENKKDIGMKTQY